jgi:hypothetical protein
MEVSDVVLAGSIYSVLIEVYNGNGDGGITDGGGGAMRDLQLRVSSLLSTCSKICCSILCAFLSNRFCITRTTASGLPEAGYLIDIDHHLGKSIRISAQCMYFDNISLFVLDRFNKAHYQV